MLKLDGLLNFNFKRPSPIWEKGTMNEHLNIDYWLTFEDVTTGDQHTVHEKSWPLCWWVDGNGSCDCTRGHFFGFDDHMCDVGENRFKILEVGGKIKWDWDEERAYLTEAEANEWVQENWS